MRILFITAYYPPCQFGWGYMRICEQVADGLAGLGHDIAVLTSNYRDGIEYKPYPICRKLSIDPDWNLNQSAAWQFFVGRRSREKQAINHLYNLVEEFRPDIVFIWHANGLPRILLQTAENLPGVKTVYYFANYLPELPDEYLLYWQSAAKTGLSKLTKSFLAKIALNILAREGKPVLLKYEHSISVSDYVRRRLADQQLIGPDAAVIPNGVDLRRFAPVTRKPFSGNGKTLKCVIAGRVAPEKGIHTALKALVHLQTQGRLQNIELTVIGDGPKAYKEKLNQIVVTSNLHKFVRFEPAVTVEKMPEILAQYDILLLPSEWHEPLACIMLEAMASNLLVIGTTTGGSGEVLFHDRTGLVFEPGNPQSLATQLSHILDEPNLTLRLAKTGQQEVVEHFNIECTIKQIEQYLLDRDKEKP